MQSETVKHTPGPLLVTESEYGDEWWFGGEKGGQIVVASSVDEEDWVTGGCKSDSDKWAALRAEAKRFAYSAQLLSIVERLARIYPDPLLDGELSQCEQAYDLIGESKQLLSEINGSAT